MTASTHPTDSSDDTDAPESVPLTVSKGHVQRDDSKLRRVHASQRRTLKALNRERDRMLKERALRNHEKRAARVGALNGGDEEEEDASRAGSAGSAAGRMEEEMEEEDDRGGEHRRKNAVSGDRLNIKEVGDASVRSGGHEEEEDLRLPDHIFAAAFKASSSKPLPSNPSAAKSKRSRKRRKESSKSLIVGSKTVRTLPDAQQLQSLATAATAPNKKVQRFVSRSLNFKRSSTVKGWERRPVNLGVLKTNGPARHFVRRK